MAQALEKFCIRNITPICIGQGRSPISGHVAAMEAKGYGIAYDYLKQFVFYIQWALELRTQFVPEGWS
jgi:hypothetical protein